MAQLTEKEAEIYDRQIRLWGVEAQRRMRASRVLIAGLGGLGAEVTKNVVLAGVNVTLQDVRAAAAPDLGSQFFLSEAVLGQNRATASLAAVRDLNPMVDVDASAEPLAAWPNGRLAGYALVVLCDCDPREVLPTAARLRGLGVAVMVGLTYGWRGVVLEDWLAHTYTPTAAPKPAGGGDSRDDGSAAAAAAPDAPVTVTFPPLADVLAAPLPAGRQPYRSHTQAWPTYAAWRAVFACQQEQQHASGGGASSLEDRALAAATQHALASGLLSDEGSGSSAAASGDAAAATAVVRVSTAVRPALVSSWAAGVGVELGPVAAVLGGVMGNEALKRVSAKDAPLGGVALFDGMGGTGGLVVAPLPAPTAPAVVAPAAAAGSGSAAS